MRAEDCKIAVYGAGAMGTVLGGFLTLGGLKNVELITRNVAHVQGLQARGAAIECQADGREIVCPVTAKLPKDMGSYDVVFLMTKQRHNQEILQGLLPHLNEGAIVCTTQNGLPEHSVAKIVGEECTFGAATTFGATFIGGGRVALTSKIGAMQMEVGGLSKKPEKLALLEEILSFAGKATNNPSFVKTTDNLLGARWSKLAINVAFSGLSVVTGMTFGEVAKKRKTRKLALGILRECMDVASALGISLAPMQGHDMQKLLGGKTPIKRCFAYLILPYAMRKHKRLESGMLKDVQAGRKCEIDFVNGVVVAQGKIAGVSTPLNEKVAELVHGVENGLYEIDYQNADFFSFD